MLGNVLKGLGYDAKIDDFHGVTKIKVTSNNFDIPEMDRVVKLWGHFNTLLDKKFNNKDMIEIEHNLRVEDNEMTENKIGLDIKIEYFDDIIRDLYKYKVSNNILFDMYTLTTIGPNAIYTRGENGFIVSSSFLLEVETKNKVYLHWDKEYSNDFMLKAPNQNQIYSFDFTKDFEITSAKWITQNGNVGSL